MIDVCELTKFAASGRALRLVMDIAAALERYKIVMEGPEGVRLRKLNRIRTIHGTTAIEGNTLTEEEVTAVIAGKRVAGSKRELADVSCEKGAEARTRQYDLWGWPRPSRGDTAALLGGWLRLQGALGR